MADVAGVAQALGFWYAEYCPNLKILMTETDLMDFGEMSSDKQLSFTLS